MVDDIVLKFQRMVDRVARWARLGVPADPGRRRFLIIQIDGLSEAVLDKALHGRRLRHIRRLLRTGRLARKPMSVGIPSSTPTFDRLLKPTRAGLSLLRLLLSAALLGWVVVKALGLTAFELARFVVRTARSPRAARSESFRWLGLKIVFSVWIRELFTLAVSA